MIIKFDRYELLERISIGIATEVFKARSTGAAGFEKIVAIKRIRHDKEKDSEIVSRFIEEAKVAAALSHSNIVQVFESGQIDGIHFIAMEYVHGKDLSQIQKQFQSTQRTMPIPLAISVILGACNGLDYAHSKLDAAERSLGILHGQICPEKILVSSEGAIKLMGFGTTIAKQSMTPLSHKRGITHISPEQASGNSIDIRSDLYMLASVLYECVTGNPPFEKIDESEIKQEKIIPPSKIKPTIPKTLETIILKALQDDPSSRFQKADELRQALERFVQTSRQSFSAKDLSRWIKAAFSSDLETKTTRSPLYAQPKPQNIDDISKPKEFDDNEKTVPQTLSPQKIPLPPEPILGPISTNEMDDSPTAVSDENTRREIPELDLSFSNKLHNLPTPDLETLANVSKTEQSASHISTQLPIGLAPQKNDVLASSSEEPTIIEDNESTVLDNIDWDEGPTLVTDGPSLDLKNTDESSSSQSVPASNEKLLVSIVIPSDSDSITVHSSLSQEKIPLAEEKLKWPPKDILSSPLLGDATLPTKNLTIWHWIAMGLGAILLILGGAFGAHLIWGDDSKEESYSSTKQQDKLAATQISLDANITKADLVLTTDGSVEKNFDLAVANSDTKPSDIQLITDKTVNAQTEDAQTSDINKSDIQTAKTQLSDTKQKTIHRPKKHLIHKKKRIKRATLKQSKKTISQKKKTLPLKNAEKAISSDSFGFLIIATRPSDAKVYVDGKSTGRKTPISPSSPLKLNSGKHKVTLEIGRKQFDYFVNISKDQTSKMIKTLSN